MKKYLSLLAVLCILLSGCGTHKSVMTGMEHYGPYREGIQFASEFLPQISELGAYTDIEFTYQETCYSGFMGFYSDGLALLVKYDPQTYEAQKSRVLDAYDFLEEPVMRSSDTYELPVTEFDYNGYSMKIVPDADYLEFCACKSFMMLGLNDDECTIAYLYYYDYDIDYIAEIDDDLEAEMRGLVKTAFAWPEF